MNKVKVKQERVSEGESEEGKMEESEKTLGWLHVTQEPAA